MSGQRGRDVLIKLSDGETPEGFVTVAGIRSTEFELSAASIDGTAADSPEGWRELVPDAGLKQARVNGRGVFKDATSDERMRSLFFTGVLTTWQLTVPGLGTLTGPLHIKSLKWGGSHDGEATFAIELESAGALSFEADA